MKATTAVAIVTLAAIGTLGCWGVSARADLCPGYPKHEEVDGHTTRNTTVTVGGVATFGSSCCAQCTPTEVPGPYKAQPVTATSEWTTTYSRTAKIDSTFSALFKNVLFVFSPTETTQKVTKYSYSVSVGGFDVHCNNKSVHWIRQTKTVTTETQIYQGKSATLSSDDDNRELNSKTMQSEQNIDLCTGTVTGDPCPILH